MSQCYDWSSVTQSVEKLPTDIWLQCPSGNTCCIGGSICLDHNLCHVPGSSSSTSGSYSSYYVARCSDPTYTSPDCQKVCDAPGPPDAVYNYTSQQWNCCGKDASGNVSCNNPTSEVFQAPAPADLKELSSGVAVVSTATLVPGDQTSTSSSTSASSLSTSSTAIPSSTSSTQTSLSRSTSANPSSTTDSTGSSQPQQTASSLSTTPSSSSLTTGAKVGIGIGVALAIIALGALIFLLLRRRQRQSAALATTSGKAEVDGFGRYPIDGKHVDGGVVEKSADGDGTVRSELSSTNELVTVPVSGRTGGRVHEIGSSR